MPNQDLAISGLTAVSALALTDVLPVVNAGVTKKATVAQLVQMSVQPLATIAALRALSLAGLAVGTAVKVTSYYASTIPDGGGGPDRVLSAVAAPATYVDNGGSIIVPTGGNGSQAWLMTTPKVVRTIEWGAKGDGVTNDSTAVGNAITYAIANDIDLEVVGKCRLASMVNIDRQVDGAAFDKYFKIFTNTGGGFYTTGLAAMFTSSIAFTIAPVSQLIFFDGLNFESDTAATRYVLNDGRFLRTRFDKCSFSKILGCSSAVYTQSIQFTNCNMRRGSGTFFKSTDFSYDFKFIGCLVEAWTGDCLDLAQPVGCAVIGSALEGISGKAIKYSGAQGLAIHGNYFEANGLDIDGTSALVANGVSVLGNLIAHTSASEYSVIWGIGGQSGCVSEGNWHTNSMHKILSNGAGLRINDVAQTSLFDRINPSYHIERLSRTAHHLQIPVVAGLTPAVTGSGTTGTASSYSNVNTGTTLNSTSRLYSDLLLGFDNLSIFGIDFGKVVVFQFNVARGGTEPNAVARVQIKTVQTEGQLAAKGFGIEIANYTISGESYGTARGTAALSPALSDSVNAQVTIVHYPGVRMEWWIDGVYAGQQTDTTKIPSGTVNCYFVHSVATTISNPSVNAQMFLMQPALWTEL